MNFQKARKIFQLPPVFTYQELRKKYHINALQFHPDKNNIPESTEKFQEIQSAFEYLKSYTGNSDQTGEKHVDHQSYNTLLHSFMESFTDIKDNISAWLLLQKILAHSRIFSLSLFDNIDIETLTFIYTTLSQHKNIFHIDDNLLSKIREKIQNISENIIAHNKSAIKGLAELIRSYWEMPV